MSVCCGEGELLLFVSTLMSTASGSEGVGFIGEGGTTMHRVVTLTLPRFLISHKSVSFFFTIIDEGLSTVDTVGSVESFDLLDCILTPFWVAVSANYSRYLASVSHIQLNLNFIAIVLVYKNSPSSAFKLIDSELSMTQIFVFCKDK